MANIIHVSPEKLTQSATRFEQTAGEIRSLTSGMTSTVQALTGNVWSGEAAAAYSPALIANFAYDLAKEFNQYYHETPVLKEPDSVLLSMRLALIGTLASTLRKAMGILGIQLPERM